MLNEKYTLACVSALLFFSRKNSYYWQNTCAEMLFFWFIFGSGSVQHIHRFQLYGRSRISNTSGITMTRYCHVVGCRNEPDKPSSSGVRRISFRRRPNPPLKKKKRRGGKGKALKGETVETKQTRNKKKLWDVL